MSAATKPKPKAALNSYFGESSRRDSDLNEAPSNGLLSTRHMPCWPDTPGYPPGPLHSQLPVYSLKLYVFHCSIAVTINYSNMAASTRSFLVEILATTGEYNISYITATIYLDQVQTWCLVIQHEVCTNGYTYLLCPSDTDGCGLAALQGGWRRMTSVRRWRSWRRRSATWRTRCLSRCRRITSTSTRTWVVAWSWAGSWRRCHATWQAWQRESTPRSVVTFSWYSSTHVQPELKYSCTAPADTHV